MTQGHRAGAADVESHTSEEGGKGGGLGGADHEQEKEGTQDLRFDWPTLSQASRPGPITYG